MPDSTAAWTPVLMPAAAFLLFLAAHAAIWQYLPRRRKGTLALALTALAVYALTAGPALAAGYLGVSRAAWVSGPVFAFLVMLYFHFYFGVDRSVSVRILGELVRAPHGALDRAALGHAYSQDEMIARRMEVMLEKGQVARANGHYRCTRKGLRLVRFSKLGRRLYRLETTG